MKSDNKISSALEDYLEVILSLEELNGHVRVTDIAKKQNIAKASVNQAIAKLKLEGLVNQEPYGPIVLTLIGRSKAKKIQNRHYKLKKFLVEVLNVDAQTADKDACQMEHAVSPETIDKLTEFLCSNGHIQDGCKSK